MLATIPIRHITEGTRLRPANEAQVAALVASIRDVGILNPITVYPRKVIVDHIAVDGYGIVAGLHRYTACKELGVEEIPANVVTLGELERQIAECDENLCGPKLSSAEKSLFTRRRKEAYEALHGSAKARGAHAANEAMGNDNAMANLADAFTTDTATRTGSSERAVRRDAERGEKIGRTAGAHSLGRKAHQVGPHPSHRSGTGTSIRIKDRVLPEGAHRQVGQPP